MEVFYYIHNDNKKCIEQAHKNTEFLKITRLQNFGSSVRDGGKLRKKFRMYEIIIILYSLILANVKLTLD